MNRQQIAQSAALLFGLLLPAHAQDAQPERPWTLMIYGAADNNADGPILGFVDSIRTALDNDPGMEILFFVDRSAKYSKDATLLGEDFTGARVYRVRKDHCELLNADEFFPGMSEEHNYEVNSADPKNIESFVAFGKKSFPARKYGLMIYSHANGCTMCPDDESGQDMGIPQLTDEVGSAASVDLLALELCNMSGVEIAYQWRPGNGGFSADALVAIPNAGPPLDWARAFERIRTPGHSTSASSPSLDPAKLSAAAFGQLVVDEGYAGRLARAKRAGGEHGQRLALEAAACLDLTKVEAVKRGVDRFAQALALGGQQARQSIESLCGPASRPEVMNYSGEGYAMYPYPDLYDLCRRSAAADGLSKQAREAAQAVCTSMDQFVVASFGMSGLEGFERGKNGIFIVLPDDQNWRKLEWYSPFEASTPRGPNGNWSFLRDGSTPDDGIVSNWFELLDSWYDDTSEDPGGTNFYLW